MANAGRSVIYNGECRAPHESRISPDPPDLADLSPQTLRTLRTYLPRPRNLAESQPIGINLQHPKETPYLINDSRHRLLQYRLVRSRNRQKEQVRVHQDSHNDPRRTKITPEAQGWILIRNGR